MTRKRESQWEKAGREWDERVERESRERFETLMADPVSALRASAAKASLNWLRNRQDYLAEERAKLQPIEDQVSAASYVLIQDVAKLYDLDPDAIKLGTFWDCKYSVTGYCIYDTRNDPNRDSCVVCHQPSERK